MATLSEGWSWMTALWAVGKVVMSRSIPAPSLSHVGHQEHVRATTLGREAARTAPGMPDCVVLSAREPSPAKWRLLVRALESRNYRLFFSGQLVSLIGTWMTRVATSWLVYRLTNSAFLLGLA